jgi:hypothetical protein
LPLEHPTPYQVQQSVAVFQLVDLVQPAPLVE